MREFGPSSWREAWSLADYVVYLRVREETESPEYQSLLRVFGAEKLNKIWEEHEERTRHCREPGDDDD